MQTSINPWHLSPPGSSQELLRRVLLGLITTLIVARPVVLGEDPGLLVSRLSDAGSLVLTLLWLAAAVGWALWRSWSGVRAWRRSIVELGLFGVVAVTFVSAQFAAPYKHPAWLISWEWMAFLVQFWLVRQLVRTPDDNHRLFAALAASALSISAYALYQYSFELSGVQGYKNNPVQLQNALAKEGIHLEVDDPQMETWMERIKADNAFATFAHPNSFAGFLVLCLPAGIIVAIVAAKQRGRSATSFWAIVAALVMCAALWITHSRGAILGFVLVGIGFTLARQIFRADRKTRIYATVVGCVFIVGILVVFLLSRDGKMGTGWHGAAAKVQTSYGHRMEYWTATWAMIRDHPWLGVGPGNFGRSYPRYMLSTASEHVSDPHNFLLEVWVSSGVFAVLCLLVAIGAFLWQSLSTFLQPGFFIPGSEKEGLEERPRTRWEYYVGGMLGLILGFILWASAQTGDLIAEKIILGGLSGGLRALVWFGGFALFESIALKSSWRGMAIVAGILALLINLTVSGGISFPSVSQNLWIMIGLALNDFSFGKTKKDGSGSSANWVMLVSPVPGCIFLLLLFFLIHFCPTTFCFHYLKEARGYYDIYWSKRTEVEERKTFAAQSQALGVVQRIRENLKAAARENGADSFPIVELIRWNSELLHYVPFEKGKVETGKIIGDVDQLFQLAKRLDPEGKDLYLEKAQFYSQLARFSGAEAKDNYRLASESLREVVKLDPTEARFRFRLAEALARIGNQVECNVQAEKALQLDQQSAEPVRRLSETQRAQIRNWLDMKKPS